MQRIAMVMLILCGLHGPARASGPESRFGSQASLRRVKRVAVVVRVCGTSRRAGLRPSDIAAAIEDLAERRKFKVIPARRVKDDGIIIRVQAVMAEGAYIVLVQAIRRAGKTMVIMYQHVRGGTIQKRAEVKNVETHMLSMSSTLVNALTAANKDRFLDD